MAEALLGALAEVVLRKVASLATEEISLLWGLNKDLERLSEKLEMIQALLYDAESKHVSSGAVQLWLKKPQAIASDADDILDEFGYDVLRQKVELNQRNDTRYAASFLLQIHLHFVLALLTRLRI